jgi:magnesium transporter
VTWINVDGLGRVDYLEKLGRAFKLHPLALEDTLNTPQRPKVDDYETHLYAVLRTVEYQESTLVSEQVSYFIGKNFLITVQEQPGDPFDAVRERLRKGGRGLRAGGPDYLAYALIDATIDSCFPSIEKLGERLEALEAELLRKPQARAGARPAPDQARSARAAAHSHADARGGGRARAQREPADQEERAARSSATVTTMRCR